MNKYKKARKVRREQPTYKTAPLIYPDGQSSVPVFRWKSDPIMDAIMLKACQRLRDESLERSMNAPLMWGAELVTAIFAARLLECETDTGACSASPPLKTEMPGWITILEPAPL